MARRQQLTMIMMAVIIFMGLTYIISTTNDERYPVRAMKADEPTSRRKQSSGSSGSSSSASDAAFGLSDSVLHGGAIAPKLENATAKAELGRASWKLFHTMMARFPEKPTHDDSLALKTYVQLFARLYPCGECATHFQKLLKKYPPQTSSRNAAAGWACAVHNMVNERLEKEQFDCQKIGDFYDCGCGDEDGKKTKTAAGAAADLKERGDITLEKEEGLTRGG